ncbi:MAG: hypothetical protein HN403_02350 [Rhodospirillales bacterium]|jgi:hypothetical protein|nr:hypothetical protein [Rhodospirillales bacterium]
MEVWIRKVIMAIIAGIGVGLCAASFEPPIGSFKKGYSINPYYAGGGATLIILGAAVGRRRIRRKKKPKKTNDDLT